MEIYTLDSLLRREQVFDQYISLIWTERFQDAGDFELTVVSTPENKRVFTNGTLLALNESYRCMKIESVEVKNDQDGRRVLNVKGRSIEVLLEDRVAFNVKDDLTTNPKWVITDKPAAVARKVFHDICITGILDVDDIIPMVLPIDLLPDDSIPEPTDNITVEIEPDSVFNVVKAICGPYDLGFRLLRNFDHSQLAFDIYSGSDRTSGQAILPVVIFSPDLENLESTSELRAAAGEKNIAYVYSNLGFEEVIALDVDPDVVGFERKILVVKVDDFDVGTAPATVSAIMQQKGREELAKNRSFAGFDGEVSQRSQYKYGVDYQLGDLVEMYGDFGDKSIMRVTEQIFASDAEGDRSYPTLSINTLITPGSWLAYGTQVWFDFDDDPTTYWASMP